MSGFPGEPDPKEIEERLAAKIAREQELADIKFLLNSPEGLRFLSRLFAETRDLHSSYTGTSEGVNFNEGRRNIGLFLKVDMKEIASRSSDKIRLKILDILLQLEEIEENG